jgi:hypothetical protein
MKIVFTSGSVTQVTNLRYTGKRKKRQCPEPFYPPVG